MSNVINIKKPSGMTHMQRRLIEASTEIHMNPNEGKLAFMAHQLVQVTLPHSDPGNVPVWKRGNGNLSLVIQPGWDHKKNESIGYPYGTIPRLLLFWIITEAIRTGSRNLELGGSLACFMRFLGLNPETGGGKFSDSKRLKNQMERLFNAKVSFQHHKEMGTSHGVQFLNMDVVSKGELWWDAKNKDQTNIFDSWIEIGEKFYQSIVSSPVPVDRRALQALKKSPLSLDIYAWSTYKNFSLEKQNRKEQFIPWDSFMQQMGAEYKGIYHFITKAKSAFKKVCAVYPGLKIEEVDRGFIIHQGKTAIRKKRP